MTDFTKQYTDFIIKQYFDKPNATGEINLKASLMEAIKNASDSLFDSYDVDIATGSTLDKIGALVGIKRVDPALNDDEKYRFFIRLKIAKNTASAFMVSDSGNSLQDVIKFAFGNSAFVVDKKTMALDLYVDDTVTEDDLILIFRLNLLPKPQAVRYNNIKRISEIPSFGFENNTLSKGFADKFDPAYNGGPFAEKIIINF
jgi:hypothetical protein